MMNMSVDTTRMLDELDTSQLQRLANTERLEGNYVAAQRTEKLILRLKRSVSAAQVPAPRP